MADKITVNSNNFKNEVLESDKTVLVDFWASWCGPCRMVSPIVEEIADEAEGFKVGKVNVDEEDTIAMQYGIMSIPTLLVFKDGEVANRSIGVASKEQILSLL